MRSINTINFFFQVHISDHSEIVMENARKFAYDYLRKRLTGRRLS